MPALSPDEQAATFRLISETTRDRLMAQRDAIDRIETKGAVLLGFSIAAAQLYVTQSGTIAALRISAFVGFGLAVAFALFVVRPYEHRYPPEPKEFSEGFVDVPAPLIEKWLGAARAEAFEANVSPATRKERFYWLTVFALILVGTTAVASLTL